MSCLLGRPFRDAFEQKQTTLENKILQKPRSRPTLPPRETTAHLLKKGALCHFLGFGYFFKNARSRPTLPPRNQKLLSAALFLRVGAASIGLRPSVHRARRGKVTPETVKMAPRWPPRWPQDGPKTRGGHAHSRAKRFDDSIRRKCGSRHGPTRHALRADLRGGEMTRRPEAAERGMRCVPFVS